MVQGPDAPPETVDGGELSKEAAFQLLSNDRRRYVLHYLDGHPEGAASLGDIATQIAAWENEIPVGDVSSPERKRVYIALHQTHLPKMAEMGVVEYDSGDNVVALEADAAELRRYLDVAGTPPLPWGRFYAAVGAISVVLVAGVAAGIDPLTAVPPIWWAGLVAVVVLVSGVYQAYWNGGLGRADEDLVPDR